MSAFTILSTGKRNKVASRVFGESVFNEMDSSLCYTPSPGGPSSAIKKQFSAANDKVSASDNIPRIDEEQDEESQTPEPTILFQQIETSSSSQGSNNRHSKGVSFVDGKENASGNSDTTDTTRNMSKITSSTVQSIRNSELSRLRASKKSPMRRDLVKKTEEAIDDATLSIQMSLASREKNIKEANAKSSKTTTAPTVSVNKSLNAIRKAKKNVIQDKSKKVKSVRFQWERENTQAKSLQQKVEENRRQIRAIQRQLSSAHFKDKARKDETEKMERLAKLEQEYIFNSEVFRDHQQQLKEERDKSRRKSIDARTKIRQNNREGEEKLKLMKLEEEQACFEVRTDLHRARMEAARANAEKRRKSFQFRAGDARRIRGIRAVWREKEFREKQQSYELERAAAKDVENYKTLCAKEEREDINSRNLSARKSRKWKENQDHEAMIAEHESYELKWAGERDAAAYKKRMQEERRKSIAGRNKESQRHAIVMEELRSLAKEQEAESFMLKWAGEEDAKAYLAKLAEERRKSLQLRGQEAIKRRQYEDEDHAKAVQKAIEDGILQSECQKDVEKYIAQCEERKRKSLQFRGKQAKMNRLKEEERRLEQMQKDEESCKLDSLARKDVEEYYKDCQKRRRKSLALRAKEKRQHFEWKRRKAQKDLKDRAHTSYLHSLDAQHMALAKEQDRARMAMDALRSAGCKLKGNPFGDILGDF